MATILLVWELGANTGHAMHAAPLVNGLVQRGHRVLATIREPAVARGLFDPRITILPGSTRFERIGARRLTNTFADLLHDIGFDDCDTLRSIASAWRNLLQLIKPDLILLDHAPTVLLASRGLDCRRIVFGPGFNCPPDVHPFPSLRPWANLPEERLKCTEAPLLDVANRVLASWDEATIQRVGQLFGDVDDTLLITFPELDCYRDARPDGTEYLGPVINRAGGVAPQWPHGAGPKIYAYLHPFNHLPDLMKLLAARDLPTLLYAPAPGLAEQIRRDFARPTLRIETQPLDLALVAHDCDLAISHAGHGMVCSLLLLGLAALHIPLHTEMGLNARAVRLLGAGLDAPADNPATLAQRLHTLLDNPAPYADAARRFAAGHAGLDPLEQRDALLDRLENTIAPTPAPQPVVVI